jgi:hypothetical protein
MGRLGSVKRGTNMRTLEQLKEHLLTECRDDEVGLWYIVKHVREDCDLQNPVDVQRLTLQLVRELLETGEVVAGWYAPLESGLPPWRIVPWAGDMADILARISTEWDQLGRDPNIGEIVVLQAKS